LTLLLKTDLASNVIASIVTSTLTTLAIDLKGSKILPGALFEHPVSPAWRKECWCVVFLRKAD
jgi:hypothetical protein